MNHILTHFFGFGADTFFKTKLLHQHKQHKLQSIIEGTTNSPKIIMPPNYNTINTEEINQNDCDSISLDNDYADIETGDRSMHRYTRSVSKAMLCEVERSKDYTRLAETIRDTGENSFGIVAIEVWEYDEYDGTLKMPGGGHWVSQYFEEKNALKA